MISSLTNHLTAPDKNVNVNTIEETSKKLASSLMSQMITSMFKTLHLPQEQELFLSFLGEAIGEHIVQSGMTDTLSQSIRMQMMRFEKNDSTTVSPEDAVEAYEDIQ